MADPGRERYAITIRVAPDTQASLANMIPEIYQLIEGVKGQPAPDCSFVYGGGALVQVIADFPDWLNAQQSAVLLASHGLGNVEVEPVTGLAQFVRLVENLSPVKSQAGKTSAGATRTNMRPVDNPD